MTPKGKGRNRRSRGKRSRSKKQKAGFDPTKHWMPEPPPKRDYEACPLSGNPVDDILTAIAHPDSGKPCNFDSVVQHLESSERLEKDERICYIGEGSFGIVKNQGDTLAIRKRIQYEDTHAHHEWRRELSPGISRDYKPDPTPLSELYSDEDIRNFEFGHGTPHSIYLPKND